MHLVRAILVLIFGTATLVLHDVRFIQWKPTVFYWLVGLVFGGSFWVGTQDAGGAAAGRSAPEDSSRARGAVARLNVADRGAFLHPARRS